MATIIGNIKRYIKDRKNSRIMQDRKEMGTVFRFKYGLFKELLTANSELLALMAEVEEKLKGDRIFGYHSIRTLVNRASMQAFQMVKSINMLSGNKFSDLYGVLEGITGRLRAVVDRRRILPAPSYVMHYKDISRSDADWVGGKNANLGEMKHRLNIPVPEGFAISTLAFDSFFDARGLKDEIVRKRNLIYVDDRDKLAGLSREVVDLIESSPLPGAVAEAIVKAWDRTWSSGDNVKVAMRSSAIGEDGEVSFAGQYLSLLNVGKDDIIRAYRSIVASLYTARAISYRMAKGIFDEDLAMAVACVKMVDSVAGGVMYTRHPYDILNDDIMIHAVWGLGTYAVDGVITPDSYTVSKDKNTGIRKKTVSEKTVRQVCLDDGGIGETTVPLEKRTCACLTDGQILTLASYGRILEEHYRAAQDVEWALDQDGNIVILQTRPLNIQPPADGRDACVEPVPGYKILVDGAEVASPGLGKGAAIHVIEPEDLTLFPEGGVLVAHHSSPEYVVVMKRCQAIVVESGSVSGHMASVAREFDVPTLIGGRDLLKRIPQGMEITVDAFSGRVYEGLVTEFFAAVKNREPRMNGTPVYDTFKQVARYMTPLHLTNPKSSRFSPSGCRTLHDIARFCHEHSYGEMFMVSDLASKNHGWSYRLDASLPIDLHVIDLGGGLSEAPAVSGQRITVDRIRSVPLLAVLSGMIELVNLEPRPISLSGFFSVMREQALSPDHVGARFGDRSYAIIADKYLNFSSRVGYHYSVVDAYCGQTINKNYITFSFQGGAANEVRRVRRVLAIAQILENEGFRVDIKSDKVDARIRKYPCAQLRDRLEILGRLLIFTRQMDMLMTSDASVAWVADQFRKGNYRLSRRGFYGGNSGTEGL